MPTTVLTRQRSWVAIFAVFAMIASLMAIAQPADAAIPTPDACPVTIPDAGFTDTGGLTPDTQHAINCLAAYDITKGTGGGLYSPNAVVDRWEMALFLTRTADVMGVSLPSGADQGFTDIDNYTSDTIIAINQLAQLAISKGCTTTQYCPEGDVTREQMALFITRLWTAAGNTLPSGADQGFTDLAGTTGEAKIAINQLVQLGISDGKTTTTFGPKDVTNRWEMALFLTRTLEADGVTPIGVQVTVTPVEAATQPAGQSRTFVATYKNADGSVYTGMVGLELLDTTSGGGPDYNNKADNTTFSATTDGLAGLGSAELNGFPGTNGVVTFTIANNGTAEEVVVVAWEDLNGNSGYSSGSSAPGEPFGLSGVTDFVTTAAPEALVGVWDPHVSKTTKADNVFEAPTGGCASAQCSFYYDANDIFMVDGAASTLQGFEDALSVGDTHHDPSATYNPDPAGQSTFGLTDNTAPLTVTDPSAPKTVNANSYTVKGAADPGATVKIKVDLNNDGDATDAGEGTVASGTADPDGAYAVGVSLTQDADNNFVAHQTPSGGVEGGAVDVPTITEGANTAAKLTLTEWFDPGTNDGVLGVGDSIEITFSEKVVGVGTGDTIGLLDQDGSSATLTCGPDVTCTLDAPGTMLTLDINTVVFSSGGSPTTINPLLQIQSVSGFEGDDGLAINVAGSGAGRVADEQ